MEYLRKSEELEFKKKLANASNNLQRELILEEKIANIYDGLSSSTQIYERKETNDKCLNTFKKYYEGDDSIKDEECCSCASDYKEGSEKVKRLNTVFGEMVEKLQPNDRISASPQKIPLDIQESLQRFRRDYPEGTNTAFIIMQFRDSGFHSQIVDGVKSALKKYGIDGLRADDKEYADDLFGNVKTYMHGCDFGIAIFERITEDDINPNVSLEVGYMMGIGKKVCLLKDSTLKGLQTDLAGKLYKPFSIQTIEKSISEQLSKWVSDKFID